MGGMKNGREKNRREERWEGGGTRVIYNNFLGQFTNHPNVCAELQIHR